MLDRKKLRQRVLLDLLVSKWTLIPGGAGLTILFILFAVSSLWPLGIFLGVLGVIAGGGSFLSRLIMGDDAANKRSIKALTQEANKEKDAGLDELDAALITDRDDRTQTMLRDLRSLVVAFKEGGSWTEQPNLFDITASVDDLFDEAVRMLQKSLALYKTAKRVRTDSARAKIFEQRDLIIDDVQTSLDELGRILADIQVMDISDNSAQERIRQELSDSLDVAKAVQSRMAEFHLNELRELKSEGEVSHV